MSLRNMIFISAAVSLISLHPAVTLAQPTQERPDRERVREARVQAQKTALLIHTAGAVGDRSQVEMIRTALRKRNDGDTMRVTMDALHALAQLGATEAVPDVEAAETRPDLIPEEQKYARIVRARLLAEADDKVQAPAPDRKNNSSRLKPPPVEKDDNKKIKMLPPSQVIVDVAPETTNDDKPLSMPPNSRKVSAPEPQDLSRARTKSLSH